MVESWQRRRGKVGRGEVFSWSLPTDPGRGFGVGFPPLSMPNGPKCHDLFRSTIRLQSVANPTFLVVGLFCVPSVQPTYLYPPSGPPGALQPLPTLLLPSLFLGRGRERKRKFYSASLILSAISPSFLAVYTFKNKTHLYTHHIFSVTEDVSDRLEGGG